MHAALEIPRVLTGPPTSLAGVLLEYLAARSYTSGQDPFT